MIKECQQEQIAAVLQSFDFEKVHRLMVFLNWIWWTGRIPTTQEIIDVGARLLQEVFEDQEAELQTVETGGLMAIRTPNNLQLIFKGVSATCSTELAAWESSKHRDDLPDGESGAFFRGLNEEASKWPKGEIPMCA